MALHLDVAFKGGSSPAQMPAGPQLNATQVAPALWDSSPVAPWAPQTSPLPSVSLAPATDLDVDLDLDPQPGPAAPQAFDPLAEPAIALPRPTGVSVDGRMLSVKASEIWNQPTPKEIEAEMEGKWGTVATPTSVIHQRIFRADGTLDVEGLHREFQLSTADSIIAALQEGTWCRAFGPEAAASVSACIRAALRKHQDTVPHPGSVYLPSGAVAQRILATYLVFARAYAPYISGESSASAKLRFGRLPMVVMRKHSPWSRDNTAAVTTFQKPSRDRPGVQDTRATVIMQDRADWLAQLEDFFSHELGHAFDAMFLNLLLTEDFVHREQLSGQIDTQPESISSDLETARGEGMAQYMANLLTRSFGHSVYEQYYGTGKLMNSLLDEVERGAKTPTDDPLVHLLRGHFRNERRGINETIKGMNALAQQPAFKDYRFAPIRPEQAGTPPNGKPDALPVDLRTLSAWTLGAALPIVAGVLAHRFGSDAQPRQVA